jgi:hypothetical protein
MPGLGRQQSQFFPQLVTLFIFSATATVVIFKLYVFAKVLKTNNHLSFFFHQYSRVCLKPLDLDTPQRSSQTTRRVTFSHEPTTHRPTVLVTGAAYVHASSFQCLPVPGLRKSQFGRAA